MIITGMILVVLAGAAKIILGGKGRPSLRRTFLSLPLVVIALSFPFLLEEGCMVPYNKSYVVTRDADAVLMKHGLIAWCPKSCVNVPREITVRLTVRKNLVCKFEVLYTVESPESLVRYLGLDVEDRVVSSSDVERAVSRLLRPFLDEYFASPYWSSCDAESWQRGRRAYWERILTASALSELPNIPSDPLAGIGFVFSRLQSEIVGVASQ